MTPDEARERQAKMAKKRTEKDHVKPNGKCFCGCGLPVKGKDSKWYPGHDTTYAAKALHPETRT